MTGLQQVACSPWWENGWLLCYCSSVMDGVGWHLKDTSALEALQRCSGRLRDMLKGVRGTFFSSLLVCICSPKANGGQFIAAL